MSLNLTHADSVQLNGWHLAGQGHSEGVAAQDCWDSLMNAVRLEPLSALRFAFKRADSLVLRRRNLK